MFNYPVVVVCMQAADNCIASYCSLLCFLIGASLDVPAQVMPMFDGITLPGGPAEVAVIAAALISTLANGWIQLPCMVSYWSVHWACHTVTKHVISLEEAGIIMCRWVFCHLLATVGGRGLGMLSWRHASCSRHSGWLSSSTCRTA